MLCPYCRGDNLDGVDSCGECGADLAGLDLPEAGADVAGRLLRDRVADLPLSPPLELPGAATVAEAVVIMRRERQGCVLVRDGGRLAGIFTEWDLLDRVVLPGRPPEATPLAAVMTADPIRLEASDPPAFAVHVMVSRGARHLPVLDGERVLGLVSVRGVLRYIRREVMAG